MRHKPIYAFSILIFLYWVLSFSNNVIAQTPLVTVQLANPQYDCLTQVYCLDVEFKADSLGHEVFGMNVRFFYEDDILELTEFTDFQGNYDVSLPPDISTSPAGPGLFNFDGPADFVNGGIQKVSVNEPVILLDTAEWSKLFSICFEVDSQMVMNLDTFCPPIVLDLHDDPTLGGYLAGDDGIVITVVDPGPGESVPAFEEVIQFNWEYIGNDTTPPYGQPVQDSCINISCSLPVHFLAFKGKGNADGNLLEWTTSDEWNNLGFEIERTFGSPNWEQIGFVKSAESRTPTNHYSFIDHYPATGKSYYRLRQIDTDGRFMFSPVISITRDPAVENLFQVFPNPINDGKFTVNIQEEGLNQNVFLQLTDVTGKAVLKQPIKELRSDINVRGIPSGIYILYILSGEKVEAERLYIQNN